MYNRSTYSKKITLTLFYGICAAHAMQGDFAASVSALAPYVPYAPYVMLGLIPKLLHVQTKKCGDGEEPCLRICPAVPWVATGASLALVNTLAWYSGTPLYSAYIACGAGSLIVSSGCALLRNNDSAIRSVQKYEKGNGKLLRHAELSVEIVSCAIPGITAFTLAALCHYGVLHF